MELSTSTNLTTDHPGGRNDYAFNIEQCARAGYKVLDINFCEAMNPTSRLQTEEWEKDVRIMAQLAEDYGIEFRQCHLPYYDLFRPGDEARIPHRERVISNMIEAAGMLGVRWCVTHPGTVFGQAQTRRSLERNLDYYSEHLRRCERAGTGLALENVFDEGGAGGHQPERAFGSSIEELVALVDAFDSPHLKACYDFGHAQMMGGYHRENLELLGDRLVATHVVDNNGRQDEHLLPFFGIVDWDECMKALVDIDYQGDLTFEVQRFGRRVPNENKAWVTELSWQVGQKLLGMARAYAAEKSSGAGSSGEMDASRAESSGAETRHA